MVLQLLTLEINQKFLDESGRKPNKMANHG